MKNKNLDFIIANTPKNLGSSQGHYDLINNLGDKIELTGSKIDIAKEIFNNIVEK